MVSHKQKCVKCQSLHIYSLLYLLSLGSHAVKLLCTMARPCITVNVYWLPHLKYASTGLISNRLLMLQHYAALVGLDDSLKPARLSYFLVSRRGETDTMPGLASLLLPSRGSRQPWRRLALFRLMYLAIKDSPDTVSHS